MLHLSNSWGTILSNVADGTTPSATAMGTAITPGNNTFPAYTEVMADTSDEAFGIEIIFGDVAVASSAKDCLVTLGFDFAGGTTYTDMTISDLMASCASLQMGGATGGFGVSYYFPLRIPAGTAIAAKASTNNATVGTVNVWLKLYCKPTRPDLIRYGSFVRTYGATEASSTGTAITPGSASEGAYVALGTTADDLWGWEFGYGTNDSTMQVRMTHVDLAVGDATNKKIVIANAMVITGSSETISKVPAFQVADTKSGDIVYGRAQGSNAPDTNVSMIAYGIGG